MSVLYKLITERAKKVEEHHQYIIAHRQLIYLIAQLLIIAAIATLLFLFHDTIIP